MVETSSCTETMRPHDIEACVVSVMPKSEDEKIAANDNPLDQTADSTVDGNGENDNTGDNPQAYEPSEYRRQVEQFIADCNLSTTLAMTSICRCRGTNNESICELEHADTKEISDLDGDPQLIIGNNDDDHCYSLPSQSVYTNYILHPISIDHSGMQCSSASSF